jgi:hypothetical protein
VPTSCAAPKKPLGKSHLNFSILLKILKKSQWDETIDDQPRAYRLKAITAKIPAWLCKTKVYTLPLMKFRLQQLVPRFRKDPINYFLPWGYFFVKCYSSSHQKVPKKSPESPLPSIGLSPRMPSFAAHVSGVARMIK